MLVAERVYHGNGLGRVGQGYLVYTGLISNWRQKKQHSPPKSSGVEQH